MNLNRLILNGNTLKTLTHMFGTTIYQSIYSKVIRIYQFKKELNNYYRDKCLLISDI